MQVVPACGKPTDLGMLPNGHPNLTKDPSAADWYRQYATAASYTAHPY